MLEAAREKRKKCFFFAEKMDKNIHSSVLKRIFNFLCSIAACFTIIFSVFCRATGGGQIIDNFVHGSEEEILTIRTCTSNYVTNLHRI